MNGVDAIRDRLIADIATAFRDVELGDGTSLHEADLEGTGTEDEIRKARAMDANEAWWDIADKDIERLRLRFIGISFAMRDRHC